MVGAPLLRVGGLLGVCVWGRGGKNGRLERVAERGSLPRRERRALNCFVALRATAGARSTRRR